MTKIKGLAGYPWPAPWAYEFQCIVIRKYLICVYLAGLGVEPRLALSVLGL